MSQPRIYAERSSCGETEYMVCHEGHHFEVVLEDSWSSREDYIAFHKGMCDGSCQPADQKARILAKIEDARSRTLTLSESGQVLPVRVIISDEVQEILDQDQIIATFDGSWYAKRSGEGEVYRLEDVRVLKLSISHDWWGRFDTGFSITLEVKFDEYQDRLKDPTQHWVAGIEHLAVLIRQALSGARLRA